MPLMYLRDFDLSDEYVLFAAESETVVSLLSDFSIVLKM